MFSKSLSIVFVMKYHIICIQTLFKWITFYLRRCRRCCWCYRFRRRRRRTLKKRRNHKYWWWWKKEKYVRIATTFFSQTKKKLLISFFKKKHNSTYTLATTTSLHSIKRIPYFHGYFCKKFFGFFIWEFFFGSL